MGEKIKKPTKTKQKSLNMAHMKDISPPHLKHNVIITEFTNHPRKGQIYYPQDGANQDFQNKIDIPHKERGKSTKLAEHAGSSPLGHSRAHMTDAIEADILHPHVCA